MRLTAQETCAAAPGASLRVVWLAVAAALLTACAPLAPDAQSAGRVQLVLPAGQWVDLERSDQTLALLGGPPDAYPLQTRWSGLRGPKGEWLAIVMVQADRVERAGSNLLWTYPCAPQRGVWVEDAAAGSAVRIDCLRLKRFAGGDDWLTKNSPQTAQWLDAHKVRLTSPYSHMSYRYTSQSGSYIALDLLVDQRLLRPPTHSNEAFLRAGRPAQTWSQQVAQAARTSTSMLDGTLVLPPFPIVLPQ